VIKAWVVKASFTGPPYHRFSAFSRSALGGKSGGYEPPHSKKFPIIGRILSKDWKSAL
jgi:hypothetical protein